MVHAMIRSILIVSRFRVQKWDALSADAPTSDTKKNTGTADFLLEPQAVNLIEKYQIPYPPHYFSNNLDKLITAADDMGYPVVLKVVSKDVVHKSDSGGVSVNIKNARALETQYKSMESRIKSAHPHAVIEGMLVCYQAKEGVELIVGAMDDPVFGPTLMVGMGEFLQKSCRTRPFGWHLSPEPMPRK